MLVTWPGAPPVRLMGDLGLRGVRRAKSPRTTRSAPREQCPADLVRRHFEAFAPGGLWVADIPPQAGGAPSYVRTLSGWVYAAFVTDVYSRRIIGWQTTYRPVCTDLALDALENGYLAAPARGRRPDGPGAPLATAACSTGPSATGRPCPRPRRSPRWVPRETSFRLRPDRGTQLAVQGRAHPLARAPGRTSTPPVLATAEWVHWYGHHPATLRHRHANPHRARSRLGTRHPPPRTITTGNHRHQTNQPPQNPRLDTPAILDGSGAPDLENLSRPGEVHPLGCLDRFDGVPHPPPVAWSRAARR